MSNKQDNRFAPAGRLLAKKVCSGQQNLVCTNTIFLATWLVYGIGKTWQDSLFI